MDWKEDLKLSFIKSAAKKGRRANQKQQQEKPSSPSSSMAIAEISSNTQNTSNVSLANTSSSSTKPSSSSLFTTSHNLEKDDSVSLDLDVSIDSNNEQQTSKTPPKKITAGWADSGSKSGRNKSKNLIEDETTTEATTTIKDDDIPIIPDLDDIQDELLMNEIVEPPSVTVNRVVTLQELDSDLLKQSTFSTLEDVDLSILTKHLQLQEMLEESDEEWEWDKIFTEISAEIHSESSLANKNEKNDDPGPIQYIS